MINEPSKSTQLMLYLEGYHFGDTPKMLSTLMDDVQAEHESLVAVAREANKGDKHLGLARALDALPEWLLESEE